MSFQIKANVNQGRGYSSSEAMQQNRAHLSLEAMQKNMISTGDLIKVKKQDQVRQHTPFKLETLTCLPRFPFVLPGLQLP